jgi:V8-like Glu-specific endopeptidase
VRANVLATAAHCLRVARAAETGLDWRSTICRRIGITFDFRSGAREKDAGWSTHCSKLVYLDEKESPNPATGGQFAGKDLTDIALMTVDLAKDDGIGAGKRLPLALGSAGDAKLFSVIQHPQGDPQRVARDCVTQSGQQGSPLFLHRCATAPGSSGAPVVFYDGEGWRLFGMHTCCAHQMAVSAESPGDLHDSLQVVNFGINVDALEKAFGTTHIGRQ